MTTFYFIRHGQAGSRDNYDTLSDLGRQQARLVGEHLATQGSRFDAVYSGTMVRQLTTAQIACDALSSSGASVAEITVDGGWNELVLGEIYRYYAPRMMESDPEFASDIREMQEAIRRDPHTTSGATGRCDRAVISAWVRRRYPDYEGESWASFHRRIVAVGSGLTHHQPDHTIAIFTSATPISVLAARSLELPEDGILKFAGVLYNSGVTVMRSTGKTLRLFTFNAASHLTPALRTFR
ncbi:MAG TPA: histidine phosphatase family protein [Blastocatellia bacterium]|nr:histidine phosphatase family protein [Blastocatellia bacterium]